MNRPGSFWRKYFTRQTVIVLVSFLFAYRSVSADSQNSVGQKFSSLKAGNEVFSNVTVTAVTATDLYFTYNGGMANVKLERLSPELQKQFHFNPQKARDQESQERKVTANFQSWTSRQTDSPAAQAEPPPVISVEVAEPTVEYKYYNNTQMGKPEDFAEETLADTSSTFICEPEFNVTPVRGTNGESLRINTAKLSVALPTTIRLTLGASQKIKVHVVGHRHINEYFYSFARQAADRAVQVVLTNQFLKSYVTNADFAQADFTQRVKMMVVSAVLAVHPVAFPAGQRLL